MASRPIKTRDSSFIAPERLYTMDGFRTAAGLSDTRIKEARINFGLKLRTHDVGIKRFVTGQDGIDYILALSKAMAEAKQISEDSSQSVQ